mmetsp:Transcript_17143/g.30784  ORF Transcript_17143/g.30784 Transcript_17143/m.30784 type:complete len:337 (+) Transcript_17143:1-1011(+)
MDLLSDPHVLNYAPLLNGMVGCFHRPRKEHVKLMQSQGVTAVFTLQSSVEGPQFIEALCKMNSISWVWVDLPGANKKLLNSAHARQTITTGLRTAEEMLQNGGKIVIHCAAGIHRTGLFLYALLRIGGKEPEEAMEMIKTIREVTWKRCGKHRIDVGELLAMRYLAYTTSEYPLPLARSLEVFPPRVLVWVETKLTIEQAVITEIIFTDELLTLCFPFDSLVTRLDYKALQSTLGQDWLDLKASAEEVGERQIRTANIGEKRWLATMRKYLKEFILAGRHVAEEQAFLHQFYPEAFQMLSQQTAALPKDCIDSMPEHTRSKLDAQILFAKGNRTPS